MSSTPLSVTELADVLKGQLKDLGSLSVVGEITGCKLYNNNTYYFTLKDAVSQVSVVLFAFHSKPNIELTDGRRVIVAGVMDFYAKTGRLSLIAKSIVADGEGDLWRRYLELKARLEAEGIFDPAVKRALPEFPKTVAFVTSPSGAVRRDFVEVLKTRRWSGRVIIVPAIVQGAAAAASMVKALARAAAIPGIDLIVVGRGGGSIEDLWCFNDERLVRAVRACRVPVISAVGHQTDHPLTDDAADVRAETPTAAAELIASGQERLRQRVRLLSAELAAHAPARKLEALAQDLVLLRTRMTGAADTLLSDRRDTLSNLKSRFIRRSPRSRVSVARERFGQLSKRLRAAGFESILARGYTLVRSADGKVVIKSADLKSGQSIRLRFSDGERGAKAD